MAQPQGFNNNYSQFDMNAIKNSKLFQKFIQNKSGLIQTNKNQPNLNNKSYQQKSQNIYLDNIHKKQNNFDSINNQRLQNNTNNIQNIKINQRNQIKKRSPIKQNRKNIYDENEPQQNQQSYQYGYKQKYHYTIKDINNVYENQYNTKEGQYSKVQPYKNIETQQNMVEQIPIKQNRRKRDFQPRNRQNNSEYINQNFESMKSIHNKEYLNSKWNKIQNQLKYQENPNFKYNASENSNQFQIKINKKVSAKQILENNLLGKNQGPQQQNFKQINSNNLIHRTKQVEYDVEYKSKYQKLLLKFQDLKREMKNQNKTRKMQLNEWQQQIEVIKQKLFQVQSRQDTLLIENQRLKQKYQYEVNLKTKSQQQAKQLTYRIKQLQDMLSMKQGALKQKNDEVNYWKSQIDSLKGQNNSLKISLEKKYDEYNMLGGELHIIKKERDHKDYLIDDLRKNITNLVEENSAAKDQLFSLVTKLYQLQQQNQTLKADLKRQYDTSSISYSNMRQKIQTIAYQKPEKHENIKFEPYRPQRIPNSSQIFKQAQRKSLTQIQKPNLVQQKPTRSRGQFARQRGNVTRHQKVQKLPKQNLNKTFQQPKRQNQRLTNINKSSRINQISQQLQKIKDMKAMNGAIRRKKIQLQRQLQQLEGN